MTYIWEILLQADEQNISRKNLRFKQVDSPSPYMEVAYEELNRNFIDEEPIDINAYYRFSSIFDYVLDDSMNVYPELSSTLYDIIMHYVAEINMREGLCKKEYYGLFLKNDVQTNKFGIEYNEVFKTFPRKQVRFVIESMVRLYEIGPSISLVRAVLRQLYPRSIVYLDSVERRELLIYIGKSETQELKKQVHFIIDMFIPFDYIIHLFWDVHFGILDVNETLEMNEFQIY